MQKKQQSVLAILFTILLLIPLSSHADRIFERFVVFGDSLSDPGNAYALSGRHLKPPYESLDIFLVPDAPYARGGNHFSNGKTWIEQLAGPLDVEGSVGPAFSGVNREKLNKSNYAVGGARAYDDGVNINLTDQVNAFFADARGVAPTNSLYVVAVGGNDVRDAIAALSVDPSGAVSAQLMNDALTVISDNIISLYGSGARSFLIANAPDLSLTPAIQRLDIFSPGAMMTAAILSARFNAALDGVLVQLSANLPGLQVARLDLMGILHEIVSDPTASGLKNVSDACIRPMQKPAACRKPNRYLFWDGIHPTKAAHRILAKRAMRNLTQLMPKVACKKKRKRSPVSCTVAETAH
jgi:outer membrane lipase/esterase